MSKPNYQAALDSAEVISIAPDMSLVNNGRRPAVEMPSDLLGPAWSIIEQVADNTSTKPDYAAVAYLAAAASLIGGKRKISPYGLDWEEPAILWMAALGDPSSRKSAPLDIITKPLWAIRDMAREDYAQALRDWESDCERAKVERTRWQDEVKGAAGTELTTPAMPDAAVEPSKPRERMPLISDVTPEAAGMVIQGNPQGTLCYNDELAGWLDSFDRYTSGGRAFWLSAFGGRPHSITRKSSGTSDLPFLGISVLGSIQPDRIVKLMEGPNDGLVPRILWAWPEKCLPRMPTGRVDTSALRNAYERLELLSWGRDETGEHVAIVLPLTDAAKANFHDWEVSNAQSDGDGGGLYETFVGKMSGAVLRLALVCEFTKWAFNGGDEPRSVGSESLLSAIIWVEDYAKPMAQRVFGDAFVSEGERNASLLARYIIKQHLELVNVRELRRPPHKSALKPLQENGALDDAIARLVEADWLFPTPSREGGSIGQQRKDYTVNKLVFGGS